MDLFKFAVPANFPPRIFSNDERSFNDSNERGDGYSACSGPIFWYRFQKTFSQQWRVLVVVVVAVVSCRAYRRHVHSLNGPRLIRKPYSIPRSVSIGEFKQVPSPGHVFESTCTIGQPLKSEEGKKRGEEREEREKKRLILLNRAKSIVLEQLVQ